ncbi:MAG: hypothetical protein ACRCSG_02800 [Cellulosilyticaceae bacterium]
MKRELETRKLTNEDIEFLKQLQQDIFTGNRGATASPRYWIVVEGVDVIVNEEDASETWLYDCCGNRLGNDVDEVIDSLVDEFDNLVINYFSWCTEFDEVINVLNEHGITGYYVTHTDYRLEYNHNAIFLTKADCLQHIEENSHHYSNRVWAFAHSGWRSPRLAQLFEILENVDFDSLK